MMRAIRLVVFGIVFGWVTPAGAQFVVSDPTNLVQNIVSATAEVQQVAGQVQELTYQFQQLQALKKNLEKLSAGDLQQLRETFRRLDELYRRAEQISMKWGDIAEEYENVYWGFDPENHGLVDYQEFRERWSQQTDSAMRAAMVSHGVVENYQQRERDLERLLSASNSAGGTLAAVQAGNQMSAQLWRQLMELSEVIASDSRARLSYLREEQARREAEGARNVERMLRNYGGDRPEFNVPNRMPAFR